MVGKEVDVRGPLAVHADGFRVDLIAAQYTPQSAASQLRVMAHLSRWLESRRLSPGVLSPDRIEAFLRARRRAGYTCWLSLRGLGPLIGYLRRIGVVPAEAAAEPITAADRLVAEYGEYLRRDRGIAEGGVRFRQDIAGELLAAVSVDALSADAVTHFTLARLKRYSVGSAGVVTTAIRCFLRFLHVRGHIHAPLVGAVPRIASWRLAALPKALSDADVEALLRACDRRTDVGRRDYAIFLLLVRLGIRAGEAAALRLDDVDWRRGEIAVHGKGGRVESLPLPPDVGDALAAYLRRGRPTCGFRTLFVSALAPRNPITACTVKNSVRRASTRAGIGPIGAHRLRHTAATRILRSGGSLGEIAQLLRHRAVDTTAIYAKVDRDSLRALAQSWPPTQPAHLASSQLREIAQPWPGAS